jgi:hypothetical protein
MVYFCREICGSCLDIILSVFSGKDQIEHECLIDETHDLDHLKTSPASLYQRRRSRWPMGIFASLEKAIIFLSISW